MRILKYRKNTRPKVTHTVMMSELAVHRSRGTSVKRRSYAAKLHVSGRSDNGCCVASASVLKLEAIEMRNG